MVDLATAAAQVIEASPPAEAPSLAPPSLVAAPTEAPPTPPSEGNPPVLEPSAPVELTVEKLKLPEGIKADDPTLKTLGEILADNKINPQERGQRLLDLHAQAHKTARDASTEAWNSVQTEWQTKTKADPEIGGAKWAGTQATIAKAIDSLGPDLAAGLREALDVTGAGNHPAVAKALHSFASRLTEGSHISGAPPSTVQSVKEAFYPNSPDMK